MIKLNHFPEFFDEHFYNKTKPNETEIEVIKTDFDNPLKCLSPYQWTSWNSYTDLSKNNSDGNDYETLDRHRFQNSR